MDYSPPMTRDSQKFINHLVKLSFILNMTVRLYHWNTTSFARHKAADEFVSGLSEVTDKLVEVFIGIYKIKPDINNITLEPLNKEYLTDDGIVNLLATSKKLFITESVNITDSQLLNIHDELIALIDQTLYLFELK